MAETNKYKIEKLGVYWNLLRLHYVGWWIFREGVWLTNFTYYWCKEDAEQALDEVSRSLSLCPASMTPTTAPTAKRTNTATGMMTKRLRRLFQNVSWLLRDDADVLRVLRERLDLSSIV